MSLGPGASASLKSDAAVTDDEVSSSRSGGTITENLVTGKQRNAASDALNGLPGIA